MNLFKSATLLLFFLPFIGFSQLSKEKLDNVLNNSSESEQVATCTELLTVGAYYQALQITDKLLAKQPNSANYNYRKGFILMEMSTDFQQAIPFLQKSVIDLDKNWDAFSTSEQSAPIDALYFMAKAYHMNADLANAEKYYKEFIAQSNSKSEYLYYCNINLKQLEVAKKAFQQPKNMVLKNVGPVINTDKPEFSPVISLDGSALYFTTRRGWANGSNDDYIDPRNNLHPEDIYVSFRDFDNEWTEPYRLEICDSTQNEATVAVSSDERRIYLYQDTKGNGDIFYSDFATNRFSDVMQLTDKKVNTDAWETHCTVTPDGQTMYFVSDRKGGIGGRDIYRVVKLPDGKWSEPQNCGPQINTIYDEESPFIAVDNKTLYFSHNGPTSMGGFDVFVAIRDENGAWSSPINLGVPLNSTCDDVFYTTTVDGVTGYLTSSRAGGKGEKDIYEIQNNELKGLKAAILKGKINTLNGAKIPEDVNITLRCKNCGDREDIKVYPRLRDGIFWSQLTPCKEYDMIFSYDNGKQEFYKETFSTDCSKEFDEVYREVWLDTKDQAIFHPYVFAGTVKDSKSKAALQGVKLELRNKTTGAVYANLNTPVDGSFTTDTISTLMKGDLLNMELALSKDGYVSVSYPIDVKLADQVRIDINKLIDPLLAENKIGVDIGALNINPIYFDYNKWDIRPDAAVELDKIVKIMKENPTIKIELGSHTDSRGTVEYNLNLSDKRAKSSAQYIIDHGIAKDRIYGKGYGESKLKVSDKQIETLPTYEEKEVAHQKNRRTEFIIVKK